MFENNNKNQFDFMDILSVLSFYIAILNLYENRSQSEHNDVQKANDKQQRSMMDKLTELFQEQNEMLGRIEYKLDSLLRK